MQEAGRVRCLDFVDEFFQGPMDFVLLGWAMLYWCAILQTKEIANRQIDRSARESSAAGIVRRASYQPPVFSSVCERTPLVYGKENPPIARR